MRARPRSAAWCSCQSASSNGCLYNKLLRNDDDMLDLGLCSRVPMCAAPCKGISFRDRL